MYCAKTEEQQETLKMQVDMLCLSYAQESVEETCKNKGKEKVIHEGKKAL